jgi:sulfopyruvate decarboxylase TPP-binding subunit
MGQATKPVLEAAGIIVMEIEREDEALDTVRAAATMAYQSEAPVAVLLTQKLLGAKAFSTE